MDEFSRLLLLIGDDGFETLRRSRVLICGIGGVGSWAAEMLGRCGIGHLSLMDMDVVNPTNINRQLIALHSTIGRPKVDVMAERLRDINPDLQLQLMPEHLVPETALDIVAAGHYNCVLDAIDERAPKIALIEACLKLAVPIVSSMGAGNKRNPELVKATDISHTFGCPLAKMIRKNLRHRGVSHGVQVVFSPELPEDAKAEDAEQAEAENPMERRPVGSISFMPAVFGMHCAAKVVEAILGSAQ